MMRNVGVPKEGLKGYIDGSRTVGRPIGRWLVAVIRVDKRVLIWGNCRRSAENREEAWRRRIEPRRAVVAP